MNEPIKICYYCDHELSEYWPFAACPKHYFELKDEIETLQIQYKASLMT